MVKLILRDEEYEVRPGMDLLAALEKCGVLSESVIATRDGELILDDEILNEGDVIKLVAVISGGSGFGNRSVEIYPMSDYRITRSEREM
jgi:sulfur carrier protein ThiS